MLNTLGWDSLVQCRAVAKVTMMYRITNKLVDIPDNQLILKKEEPTDNGAKKWGIIKKFQVPPSPTWWKAFSSPTPSVCGINCPSKSWTLQH